MLCSSNEVVMKRALTVILMGHYTSRETKYGTYGNGNQKISHVIVSSFLLSFIPSFLGFPPFNSPSFFYSYQWVVKQTQ